MREAGENSLSLMSKAVLVGDGTEVSEKKKKKPGEEMASEAPTCGCVMLCTVCSFDRVERDEMRKPSWRNAGGGRDA